MNNHECGVSPSDFNANSRLTSFYNVLSNNVDRNGKPFVSSIEGKTVPVYATQWHPEKNAFEWTPEEAIPHSLEAVRVCTYMAQFFVNEARKSTHSMPYNTLMSSVRGLHVLLFFCR